MSKLKFSKAMGDSYVVQNMTCPKCGFFLATEQFDSNAGFGPQESYQYFRNCPLCGWKEWENEGDKRKETKRVISKNPEKDDLENAKSIIKSIDNLEKEDKEAIIDYLDKLKGKLTKEYLRKILVELIFE